MSSAALRPGLSRAKERPLKGGCASTWGGWSSQASDCATLAGRMALALALHLEEVMMFSAHRNRHLQCGHGQASLQARCLARAWQRWVDAHWVEQLSRSLVGRLNSSSPCRRPGNDFSHLHPIPCLTNCMPLRSLSKSLGTGSSSAKISLISSHLFHPGVVEVEGPGLAG